MGKGGSTTDDDSVTLELLDHERGPRECQKCSRWDRVKRVARSPLIVANIIFFIVSLRGYWLWWHIDGPKADSLLKQSSYYCKRSSQFPQFGIGKGDPLLTIKHASAPLLNMMEDIPRVSRMSFGEYGDGGDTALWRGPPSDELDEAWEHMIPDRPILPVTKSDILAMNKDPSVAVKMPEKYWRADGEETYMAKPAAFHNLHCLDYVRRTVYKDHYWPNGTDGVPFHDTHVTHCLMLLKEHLTCAPDPGVTGEFLIPGTSYPSFVCSVIDQNISVPVAG